MSNIKRKKNNSNVEAFRKMVDIFVTRSQFQTKSHDKKCHCHCKNYGNRRNFCCCCFFTYENLLEKSKFWGQQPWSALRNILIAPISFIDSFYRFFMYSWWMYKDIWVNESCSVLVKKIMRTWWPGWSVQIFICNFSYLLVGERNRKSSFEFIQKVKFVLFPWLGCHYWFYRPEKFNNIISN